MASKIADAFVEIGARTAKFEKELRDVQKRLDSLENDFKKVTNNSKKGLQSVRVGLNRTVAGFIKATKIAIVFFAAIGTASVLAVKTSLDAAASFENLEVRMVTLLGSTEDAAEAMKFFSKQAEKVPFSLEQVAAAGVTLTAMGADFKKWLPLAADVAAVMGVDIETAASQMGRAFSGGAGAADVFREKGILNIIRESRGIKDLSKITLPEFRKAMFETFVDPQGKIEGAAKGLSRTWVGQLSMVGDAVFKLKKSFGEALLPAMKDLVSLTIKPLVGEWGEWAEANKELIKTGFTKFIKEAVSFSKDFGKTLKENLPTFRDTAIVFLDMGDSLLGFLKILALIPKGFGKIGGTIKAARINQFSATIDILSDKLISLDQSQRAQAKTIQARISQLQKMREEEIKDLDVNVRREEALNKLSTVLDAVRKRLGGVREELGKTGKEGISAELAAAFREIDAEAAALEKRLFGTGLNMKKIAQEADKILDTIDEISFEDTIGKEADKILDEIAKGGEDLKKTIESISFVGLEEVFKRIQVAALGAPGVGRGGRAAIGSKEAIDIAKEQRQQLKKLNVTLATREFVPTAA